MKSSAKEPARVQPATVASISFAYFVSAVTALYFLNPAYGLIKSFTGNYDLGSFEFLIASTFFSLGLGSLALVFGLYQGLAQAARSRVGLLLLGLWGVGMLIAGIFPANAGGSTVAHRTTILIAGILPVEVEAYPETTFSYIHIFALLLSFLSLTLATILLSRRFGQDQKWRPIHRMALILAVLMCAASILFFLTLPFPGLLGFTSYGPLVFIITGLIIGIIWLLLVAARLRFFVNRPVSK